MVLEDISERARLFALAAAFVASLVVLALVTALYPFIWYIWYILYIALIGFIFSRHDTSLTLKLFYLLFSIRYLRVVVNIGGFFWYKATPTPDLPSLTARHVAVIVPTVEPHGQHFETCIQSILANNPSKVIIVTAGPGNYKRAVDCVTSMSIDSKIQIKDCNDQDKRRQIYAGLEEV